MNSNNTKSNRFSLYGVVVRFRELSARTTRFQLVLLACCSILLVGTIPNVLGQHTDSDDISVSALINDLSAPKFVVRQRAMNRLVAIGADAIPQLNSAIRNGNRETRFRAGRVLDAVEQNVFQQKLEQFIKAGVGDEHIILPSWNAFCEKIPETAESRRVFALISRAEPGLCRSIEHGSALAAKEIDRRCARIQITLQEKRMSTITLGTITGLLFAAGMDDLKLNRYSMRTIFGLCHQPIFADKLRVRSNTGTYTYPSTASARITKELFAGCLVNCKSWDAQAAFSLAMNLNIGQCLPRALELVLDKQTPCHVVQTVMIAISMFGDKDDIPVLESRIADKSFCGVTQRINDVQYQTQLRDVAIAAMLILAKEDPKLYGFPRIQVYTSGQFSYSRVGFANDASRDKTRGKWDIFRQTLKVPRLDGK